MTHVCTSVFLFFPPLPFPFFFLWAIVDGGRGRGGVGVVVAVVVAVVVRPMSLPCYICSVRVETATLTTACVSSALDFFTTADSRLSLEARTGLM